MPARPCQREGNEQNRKQNEDAKLNHLAFLKRNHRKPGPWSKPVGGPTDQRFQLRRKDLATRPQKGKPKGGKRFLGCVQGTSRVTPASE